MRTLDEQETTAVFEKLFKFVGNNLKNIVDSPSHEGPGTDAGRYCFRLQKNRCYYVSEAVVKRATNISRDKLVSLGTQVGKFTHHNNFHLTIQAVSILAANAKHKVWLKPTSEMSFLYGNHVLKGGLGRITENINSGDGVVVFSMSDVPLGFGIAAKSTTDCRKLDPNGIVVLHQADIGCSEGPEDTYQIALTYLTHLPLYHRPVKTLTNCRTMEKFKARSVESNVNRGRRRRGKAGKLCWKEAD